MRAVVFVAIAFAIASCDPVHQEAVDDLGPEQAGVPKGPTHRPGQPCLVCHGGSGPGSPTFSVAGTVFRTKAERTGAAGVLVILADADGVTKAFRTNEVGTFYVQDSQWAPRFPLRAVVRNGTTDLEMKTLINGDGSCGSCHRDPAAPDAVGHVYAEQQP